MAFTGQGAPYVAGGLAWAWDDASGDFIPCSGQNPLDRVRSIGRSGTGRALVNGVIPTGIIARTKVGSAAVADTTDETAMFSTATLEAPAFNGSPAAGTMPAGYLNAIGRAVRVRAFGVITNTGTPNLTVSVYVGTIAVLSTGVKATAAITGTLLWFLEGAFWCSTAGATGKTLGQGKFTYFTTAPVSVDWAMYQSAESSAIDLTAAKALDIKATWGAASASNSITLQYGEFSSGF